MAAQVVGERLQQRHTRARINGTRQLHQTGVYRAPSWGAFAFVVVIVAFIGCAMLRPAGRSGAGGRLGTKSRRARARSGGR